MGYKSFTFRLALLKERDVWKIFLASIVFEDEPPKTHKQLVKTDGFVLKDFSLSIDDFNNFLEYLKKVNVGSVQFQGHEPIVTEEYLYNIGNYKLCFLGNFSNMQLYFFRREIGRSHGVDKPLYFTDYFIHDSVRARAYQNIDLTSNEPPFKDPIDAINYFWKVNYQPYQVSSSCPILMPVFDASITNCIYDKGQLRIKLDIDKKRVKENELTLSIIIEGVGNLRQKYPVTKDTVEIELDSEPGYVTLYLNKNMEKLDEYYYRSEDTIKQENEFMKSIDRGGELPDVVAVNPFTSIEKINKTKTSDMVTNSIDLFKKYDFDVEPDLCFMLMPFKEPFTSIYNNHIKPTLEKAGFRVMIASDIFTPTPIIEDIWEYINKANLIVADVTGKNPNVFYELGIAHTLAKYVAIITQNADDVPFDLRHLRYFPYADNKEGLFMLRGILDNIVQSLRKPK